MYLKFVFANQTQIQFYAITISELCNYDIWLIYSTYYPQSTSLKFSLEPPSQLVLINECFFKKQYC